jgi:hypothetical protein
MVKGELTPKDIQYQQVVYACTFEHNDGLPVLEEKFTYSGHDTLYPIQAAQTVRMMEYITSAKEKPEHRGVYTATRFTSLLTLS